MHNGGVFGKNGNAPLAFQRVGIHDTLLHGLIGTKSSALAEHGVNQSGFAVVNVGHDGEIADIRADWQVVFLFSENMQLGFAKRNSLLKAGGSGKTYLAIF
jgi:hypothetical protein